MKLHSGVQMAKTDKILTLAGAARVARELRASGRSVVLTNGCFDLLHRGHVEYLTQAREMGDALVVAVNNDASVRKMKGPGRPIVSLADRAYVLSALACVDYVVPFEESLPLRVIERVRPDVLVKGGDWPVPTIAGRDAVESTGGRVVSLASSVPDYSTTRLVGKIIRTLSGLGE